MLPTISDVLTQSKHSSPTVTEEQAKGLVAAGQKHVQLTGPLGATLTAALKNLYAKPPSDDWKVVVSELKTADGVVAEVALETILLNNSIAAQTHLHSEEYKASELDKNSITGFAIDVSQLNADPAGAVSQIREDVGLKGSENYTVVIDGVDTTQKLPTSVKHACTCCESLKVRVVMNPMLVTDVKTNVSEGAT